MFISATRVPFRMEEKRELNWRPGDPENRREVLISFAALDSRRQGDFCAIFNAEDMRILRMKSKSFDPMLIVFN